MTSIPPTQSPAADAEQIGEGIFRADDSSIVFSNVSILMDNLTARGEIVEPLTPSQVLELNYASQGVSVGERELALRRSRGIVAKERVEAIEKLRGNNIVHAVRNAIVMGILPIEKESAGPPKLKPKTVRILSLVSEGIEYVDIAKKLGGGSRGMVDYQIATGKRMLVAKNRPHLVRRAFETGIFPLS